ncbi:exocyst complex component EXO70A1-like [Dioscorea cayenensis subsp. rotundata]|uniref:Exocyst subunit Exo70 family protein n=1 Tax=Dioscorea cayennensis subsp. rotundata TaxID=55577 RepID=A0AB40BKH7_DIOCR|nr:exocyst complex component EXO70A1-like [Dioscorea cayenensis subsp. rotundata]
MASSGSSEAAMPSPAMAIADVEAAEQLIHRWDPVASPSHDRMLFDGSDRADAELYLRAIDHLRQSLGPSSPAPASPSRSPSNTIQIAMARLEDEFRNLLLSRSAEPDLESLDLGSLSISSLSSDHDHDHDHDRNLSDAEDDPGGGSTRVASRSASSIREIDLVPPDAVQDLRSIAERMVAAGYARECAQAYSSARKSAVDTGLRHLGVERLSIGDVQRLEWEALEAKIRRWIRAARACVRVLFASERRLCDQVFGTPSSADAPFAETVKGAAIQLLSFPEAISIGRRSPEKLFKILDLHDALSDLLPDIAAIFRSGPAESIHTQAAEILARLAEAARGTLSEFENAVLREASRIPVPGGTLHPLTRYVMNYISLISDYQPTLNELIVTTPSARFSGEETTDHPEINFPDLDNRTPLASHLVWIIVVLQHNLENKASLYKDAALSHLFLMNNLHYIVNKVKDSPELRGMIGDEYLRRLTGKYRQLATSYQRTAWVKILHCLRDEGIHVSGSFSSGVSKSTLRERFKAFNAAFDEAYRTQAAWFVPDPQLREELRISISERLLPAYRAFLGRFRHHIESGRHPEVYIKYSVEDLEMALMDFFEGCPPSVHGRKRSH